MYEITRFTAGCTPTRTSQAEDLEAAKESAVEEVEWLFERAYSARDTAEIDGQEDEYDILKKQLSEADGEIEVGPLPDGYYVKIAEIES